MGLELSNCGNFNSAVPMFSLVGYGVADLCRFSLDDRSFIKCPLALSFAAGVERGPSSKSEESCISSNEPGVEGLELTNARRDERLELLTFISGSRGPVDENLLLLDCFTDESSSS